MYLELGSIFPRLSAEMGRSADIGERSLQGIASLGEAGLRAGSKERGLLPGRRHRTSSAPCASAIPPSSIKINEGISRLGDMDQIIAQGPRGFGGDGDHLAQRDDRRPQVRGRGQGLLRHYRRAQAPVGPHDRPRRGGDRGRPLPPRFFARLRNALAELGDFQRDFFDDIDETLGSGYEEVERDIADATSFFSKLLEEARGVRGPVLRVMGEVQLQDIVRQSLQHVGISLEEARESAATEGEARTPSSPPWPSFPRASSTISGQARVERRLLRRGHGGGKRHRGRERVGPRRLPRKADARRPADAESLDFGQRSERYLELKRVVVTMSSRLSEQVGALDGSFKGLAALLARFQNIVVASRIEVAKTKALAGVATTVGGMVALTDQDRGGRGRGHGDDQGLHGPLERGHRGVLPLRTGPREESSFPPSPLSEEDMARLFSAKAALRDAIDHFSLYTDDFIGLIGRAGEAARQAARPDRRPQERRREPARAQGPIREGLGPEAQAVESERMRRMVERFTIFTHKKAAGEIGRFAVEEGREAGEVTMF